jgi:hypothetical protein
MVRSELPEFLLDHKPGVSSHKKSAAKSIGLRDDSNRRGFARNSLAAHSDGFGEDTSSFVEKTQP